MFPDLSKEKILALDLETRDEHLIELGCGARRGAIILGVGVGTKTKQFYFPLNHIRRMTNSSKAKKSTT